MVVVVVGAWVVVGGLVVVVVVVVGGLVVVVDVVLVVVGARVVVTVLVVVVVVFLWPWPPLFVVFVPSEVVRQPPGAHASQQLGQSLTVPPSAAQVAASGVSWQLVRPLAVMPQQMTNPDRPQTDCAAHRLIFALHSRGSTPVATRSFVLFAAQRRYALWLEASVQSHRVATCARAAASAAGSWHRVKPSWGVARSQKAASKPRLMERIANLGWARGPVIATWCTSTSRSAIRRSMQRAGSRSCRLRGGSDGNHQVARLFLVEPGPKR